ncbi:hypothetical protein [Lacihabitans soyangensis]|uniref:Uncharacterized protein n=1 Tax=Lacihabitans soyangensis TaxID=869394 RepID=A0AAE3H103_9BACT|nr:hypothetical protein [Lacihabitans soyangensis]MCP9762305.1 hypothetical protein [Lacihabitans soyangensis]
MIAVKNTAVIFDTNSYRNFVIGKSTNTVLTDIQALREKEREKNIIAFGSQVVGMEMLANLAEGPTGFNYTDCLNGVIAMAHHCFDYSDVAPRIIPHPYLHITRPFFGIIPPVIEQRSQKLKWCNFGLQSELYKSRNISSVLKNFSG